MTSPLPQPAKADFIPTEKPTQDEGRAALRFFFNMAPKWQISDSEARMLLGELSQATFYRWKKGEVGTIPHDTLWRLGDILGISKGLRYLFREPERGYFWLKKPNEAFAGQSALDVMLSGPPGALTRVRNYIDAERGGW